MLALAWAYARCSNTLNTNTADSSGRSRKVDVHQTTALSNSRREMDLSGKVAVVTGGARGLGRALAEALLHRGAKVVVADVSSEAPTFGSDHVTYCHCDVTNQKQMEDMFDQVWQTHGRLDIVINNAATCKKDTDSLLETNLRGVIRGTELAFERMRTDKEGNGGVIVNIASISGMYAMPFSPVYHATKFAAIGFTRSFALAHADKGVGVRVLCPGAMRTEMTRDLQQGADSGNQATLDMVKLIGGWVQLSAVVDACMACIERQDLPKGAVVKADPTGTWLMDTNNIAQTPFYN